MRVVNASCVSDDTPKHSSTPALSGICRAGEARGNPPPAATWQRLHAVRGGA